ncbi:MAG: hypothetical protein FJ104_06120, partial [Deltaproteobacteria bacterium]|nr:hypothetical protein [Deltaproteobacteria bacterium]
AHGRRVSRFGIAYLAEPGGGTIDVSVDGERLRVVDTAAPARRALFEAVEVSDGEHRLELLTGRGSVRLFGLTLERDVPGVVLDAIGVVGARLRTFAEIEPAHLAEAVAWRRPSLITFQFGANESGDGFAIPMPEYHAGMADMIRRFRAAAPGASCLVIGVMDRARKEGDRLVTVPVIPHLAREQRAVAAELGCAHYSGFDLMGGEGGMARWVRKGLGAGDFTHPTSQGAAVLGEALHDALMRLYESSSAKNAPR